MKLNTKKQIILILIFLLVSAFFFGYEFKIFNYKYFLIGLRYDLILSITFISTIVFLFFIFYKINHIKSFSKRFINRHSVKILVLFGVVLMAGGGSENNNIRVFNVKLFGAKGNNSTNDTRAIQLTVNACDAAGGGVVWFPNGIYLTGDTLYASTSNSQIYIPTHTFSDAARTHIKFMGEGAPNFVPVGTGLSFVQSIPIAANPVIIKSTLTSGSTGASILGTGYAAGSTYNETFLTVENIAFQVKNNPSGSGPVVGGISYKKGASLQAKNVVVYIDTSGYRSTTPTNDVVGIETPDNSSETFNNIENVLVLGFRTGLRVGEHVMLTQAQAMSCYRGIDLKQGYHNTAATRVGTFWCAYDIFVSGLCTVANFQFDTEWQQIGKWYDDVATIKDSLNNCSGTFFYTIIRSAFGKDNSKFIKTGGTNISAYSNDMSVLQQVGTLGIANGGTGQTTAANAGNALLPSQTGHSGHLLSSLDGAGTLGWVSGTGGAYVALDGTTPLSGNWNAGAFSIETKQTAATAATIYDGIKLTNSTTASSGNQYYSPALILEGQGWKTTATAASQSVKAYNYVIPIQGGAAPSATIRWGIKTNGGAETVAMTYTNDGSGFFINGGLTAGNTSAFSAITATSTFNLNTTTGGAVSADGATIRNSTASTVGTPIQFSPRLRFSGTGWSGAISQLADFVMETEPVNGTNPITANFKIKSQVNALGYNDVLTISELGKQSLPSTITAGGTTGNQTINKPTGTVNIAAAGTTVTVTNSVVTTSSIVYCVIRTNDATATIKNVVPSSGSFVITLNAAATAEVSIGFIVFN